MATTALVIIEARSKSKLTLLAELVLHQAKRILVVDGHGDHGCRAVASGLGRRLCRFTVRGHRAHTATAAFF